MELSVLQDILNRMLSYSDTDECQEFLDRLRITYPEDELVNIYNYLLQNSQRPEVTMYLIRCVDMYRKSSSLSVLVDILLLKNANYSDENIKEKYDNIRIMCAKAISNQKDTSVVSALLYCLNNKNENYRVRLACADALGHIGDRFAVAPLIDVVKDEEEKSVYVRESAVSALSLLGDERALDPLVSILETKQGIMNKFSFLKERVLEALIKIGVCKNARAYKAIKDSLLDESPQVRINAIEALMESDNPRAYDDIKKCLDTDTDFEVQKNAMIALYNMSDRAILDEVITSDKYSDNLKLEASSILNDCEEDEE